MPWRSPPETASKSLADPFVIRNQFSPAQSGVDETSRLSVESACSFGRSVIAGGTISVALPKDLAAGRYHVLFQVTDGDKIISTGHHFAADL